jgi:hypothetical protein
LSSPKKANKRLGTTVHFIAWKPGVVIGVVSSRTVVVVVESSRTELDGDNIVVVVLGARRS